MASRGPKTGTRKPAIPGSSRPVAKAGPVVAAAPEQVKSVEKAPEAAPPPVAFLAEPAPAPVELPQQIEAVIAAAADAGNTVATTVTDTVTETTQETTATAQTVAGQIEEKTMDVTNAATAAAQNTADKAQNVMADMNEKAKAALEKSAKGFEEMNDMAKGNVEALVEASRIAAKGLETLGQEMAEYGRKSFESATAAAKTLATVKSPTEFMKLQSDFVRQSFDSFVAEASKTTEMMMKLAGDAAQPISNRVAVAADKVKTVG